MKENVRGKSCCRTSKIALDTFSFHNVSLSLSLPPSLSPFSFSPPSHTPPPSPSLSCFCGKGQSFIRLFLQYNISYFQKRPGTIITSPYWVFLSWQLVGTIIKQLSGWPQPLSRTTRGIVLWLTFRVSDSPNF